MTDNVQWTTRRPILRKYTKWTGDNLAELEAEWPEWTFEVNLDTSLHARSEYGEFDGELPVGTWFTYDDSWDVDPLTTERVQAAPGPGLTSFTITAD